jgi:hypothetical protein
MEAMRDSWNDDRLDEFAAQTDRRFDRLEHKIDERFDKIDQRFDKIDERFKGVDERFEGLHLMMHRTMVQLTFALGGTVAFGFLGIIVTQLLK